MMQSLITVWQICIGDQWRFATPEVAAMVAVVRPGNARLVEMPVPASIRFERMPRYTPPAETGRRRTAAVRAIQKQKDQAGLFAHLLPEITPEQRMEQYRNEFIEWEINNRIDRARQWRQARQMIRTLPDDTRTKLLFRWNVHGCPASPIFLMGMAREVAA